MTAEVDMDLAPKCFQAMESLFSNERLLRIGSSQIEFLCGEFKVNSCVASPSAQFLIRTNITLEPQLA